MTGHGVDEDKRATLRRFAALGAATPLTGLLETGSSPDTNVREAILGYLVATPGAHFSKIRDDLKLGTGETQHHLNKLVDASVIESHRDGDYRRFYPSNRFDAFEQVALGYLRRSTPRGMILALLRTPGMSGSELAGALGVSAPTISKYAGELANAGLLDRDDGYVLNQPESLLVLIVRYADSFDTGTMKFAAEAAELIAVR
jgi:predicted transcriptional regulator